MRRTAGSDTVFGATLAAALLWGLPAGVLAAPKGFAWHLLGWRAGGPGGEHPGRAGRGAAGGVRNAWLLWPAFSGGASRPSASPS